MMTFRTFVFVIFGIFAILLMLCTIIEIVLAGGFDGLILRQGFPWLIAGWCFFLIAFYIARRAFKRMDEEDGNL